MMNAENMDQYIQQPTDYWWEIDGEKVYLHHGFNRPVCYDKKNLEITIANVRNARATYATAKAYEVDLRKFELGLSILKMGSIEGSQQ